MAVFMDWLLRVVPTVTALYSSSIDAKVGLIARG
jgi:hypothetical protein